MPRKDNKVNIPLCGYLYDGRCLTFGKSDEKEKLKPQSSGILLPVW